MSSRGTYAAGALLAVGAMVAVLPAAGASATTTAPTVAPGAVVQLVQDDGTGGQVAASAPAMEGAEFDPAVVALMARTSGRSYEVQLDRLERQAASNTTLAGLQADGYAFDGAFLAPDGGLVVQAEAGSAEAAAAQDAGAAVRDPQFGESDLEALRARLAGTDLGGVATLEVDVVDDQLVLGASGPLSVEVAEVVDAYDAAVTVVDTTAYSTQIDVRGGDAVYTPGGGRCSAGFPARSSSGVRYMIWAGHCNEGGGAFTSGGQQIGVSAGSAFTSYDGQPDRDIGALRIDSGDRVLTSLNRWGTSGYDLDAPRGASRPAVGTELCKSGSTTGITCGTISSYNNTVNYTDNQGRQVATVSGLMRTTVCTEGGDSGGAYTAGGYAVGLTSGGPSTQRCTYNGGFQSGKSSLVQPVTDALSYYGLSYDPSAS